MRKWIYLVIGIVLITNGVIAIGFLPYPFNILQALWGLLGIFLLWKAIKRFGIGDSNARQWFQANKGWVQLTSLAIASLLFVLVGWLVGLISLVLFVITFEVITRGKREEGKRVEASSGNVWQRIESHKRQIHLTSLAIAFLLFLSGGWQVGSTYLVLFVVTFEAITRGKRRVCP